MNGVRPDVVFDCNTFLQAICRPRGPAAEALRLMEGNHFTLHLSRSVMREVRAVMDYPEVREANPAVTDEVLDEFFKRLLFRGHFQSDVPRVFHHPRDPADEPYVDLVAAVLADYLVTWDKDLLSLATEHTIEAKQFRQRFSTLHIVTPVDFLRAITSVLP